jgi:biotin carboxyl carrier protein
MPGKIMRIPVSVGQAVKNGDVVVILEAMKMENEIFSAVDGTVTEIRANSGDSVNTGDLILVIG